MANQLELRVGADIRGAVQGMNALENKLKTTSNVVQKSQRDYTGLSRVLQDLPFGFTAISNNLTQLIPAAGAAGLAFSALTSVLTFASVGFSSWVRGSKSTEKSAEDLKSKLESLIKPISDISAAASGGDAGEIAQVRALSSVVLDQTESYTKRNRALNELKEINKNYFGDLTLEESKLKTLTERVEEYSKALVTQSVIKAFSDEIGNVSKELAIQQNQLKNYVKDVDAARNKLNATTQNENPIRRARARSQGGVSADVLRDQQDLDAAIAAQQKQLQAINKLADQRDFLFSALNDAVRQSLDFKPLTTTGGGKTPPNPKIQKEFLFQLLPFDPNGKLDPGQKADLLKAVGSFQKEFGSVLAGIDFQLTSQSDDQVIDKARQWWEDFKKGLIKFKPPRLVLESDVQVLPKEREIQQFSQGAIEDAFKSDAQSNALDNNQLANVALNKEEIIESFRAQFAAIGQELPRIIRNTDGFGRSMKVDLNLEFNTANVKKGLQDAIEQAKRTLQELTQTITASMRQAAVSGFASLGEAIGTAVAGGDVEDVFRGMFATIGGVIQQLGASMIALSPLVQSIQASISSFQPAGILAAGIGLVALGAAVQTAFSKTAKFADGGLVFGPTMGLVGEGRGTNRSNPEVIAPLDKLQGFLQGAAVNNNPIQITGEFRTRGKDLALSLSRYQGYSRRNV